jgi:hypothetical protein
MVVAVPFYLLWESASTPRVDTTDDTTIVHDVQRGLTDEIFYVFLCDVWRLRLTESKENKRGRTNSLQ